MPIISQKYHSGGDENALKWHQPGKPPETTNWRVHITPRSIQHSVYHLNKIIMILKIVKYFFPEV